MAKYRQVHTTFWNDSFVIDLTPEEKYFYLYLMTNDQTTQCGIYELPKRVIEMQTGYNRETVDKLLSRFEEYGKVKYNEETKEIYITNWAKYNWINSIKVIKCIEKELKNIKCQSFVKDYISSLKLYGYRIDTISIDSGEEKEREEEEEREREKEREKERETIIHQKIINMYNEICVSFPHIKILSDNRKKEIEARIKSGYILEDFETLFTKAENSSFLKGKNNSNWNATFDWLIKDENMAKVLDGNYDNKGKTQKGSNPFLEMLKEEDGK